MFEDVITYVHETQTLETLLFAKKLGMTEVVLLFIKHSEENKKITEKLSKESKVNIVLGLDVNAKEAQKQARNYTHLFSLATREAIENKWITQVYGAEILEEKDKTHQRGSGLNHVLAKMIFEKKKTYCYDLSLVLQAKDKGMLLGRMQQNKRFFTKYKVQTQLFSFASTWNEIRTTQDRKHFLNKM